jgi:RNA polymerase sigma-70 factor (ECF subfamily)
MPTKRKAENSRDEDRDLIRAINAGHTERYFDLVHKYQRRLYNFGLRMCADAVDSEDMVQETFLNVFRYLKDFRHETKFKNWLYRVATSVCIKQRRRSKFAPQRELSLEEFLPRDEAQIPTEVPPWAARPLDRLLSEELHQRVRDAIMDLPDKYRTVMVLRDLEEFSTAEAAEILDLTPANVKVRLHRARLFVREHLKEYFEA